MAPPSAGYGKTCLLRNVARVLADKHDLSVVVVDAHGDVAGDGSEPHECIGGAQRMVTQAAHQAARLLQLLHNVAPQVVVIDEVAGAAVSAPGWGGGGRQFMAVASNGAQERARVHTHTHAHSFLSKSGGQLVSALDQRDRTAGHTRL